MSAFGARSARRCGLPLSVIAPFPIACLRDSTPPRPSTDPGGARGYAGFVDVSLTATGSPRIMLAKDRAGGTRQIWQLTSAQSLASTEQARGVVRAGIIDRIRCEVLRRELSPKPLLQTANAKEAALANVFFWIHGLHPRCDPHVIMDHVPLPADTRTSRFCARRGVHAAVVADRTQGRPFNTLIPDATEASAHPIHVSGRVLHVGVAHVLLNQTHVPALHRQRVAASMP
jgi:hypothetical protein